MSIIRIEDRMAKDPVDAGFTIMYHTIPQFDVDKTLFYAMESSVQEILPGLFLGGAFTSYSRDILHVMAATGLTHIVWVGSDLEAPYIRENYLPQFKYHFVEMDDPPNDAVIPKFRHTSNFINDCLCLGGKVLVQGRTGTCRSVALVAAFIMSKFRVNVKVATGFIRSKRSCIQVSKHYLRQLREYEPIYLAEQHIKPKQMEVDNTEYGTIKREFDILDDSDFESMDEGIGPSPEKWMTLEHHFD